MSSLLTVCSCAFRPLIYLICQPALRKEVFCLMKGIYLASDESGDTAKRTQITTTAFERMYNSVSKFDCRSEEGIPKLSHQKKPSATLVLITLIRDQGRGRAARGVRTPSHDPFPTLQILREK